MAGTHILSRCFAKNKMECNFYENMQSRLPNFELYHDLALTNFKHQESAFYEILFNESDEGPFESPPFRTKVGVRIKSVPCFPKMYVFHNSNISFVFCSLLSAFLFVGEKVQKIIIKTTF